MNSLLNLSENSDSERALMEHRKIDFNKIRSKIAGKSRRDSKPSKCLYCEEETSKFCNSHSVPAFILRNIAVDGEVYITNKIMNIPIFETDKGIKESGTFKVICRDCDSEVFKEYETPNSYDEKPTDKMIAQMAMKNHLRNVGKRRYEVSLYNNMKKQYSKSPLPNNYINGMIEVSALDLNEYIRGFKRAKKVIEKSWNNEFYLFCYEKLNYVVPIAFQGEVSLHFDLEGNTINNVYNSSKKYIIQSVHISIFPLDGYSIIMMFIDKKNKRYRRFYQQFMKLNHEERLAVINFIIFSYSEDVFMNKNIHDIAIENENLQKITGLTSIQYSDTSIDDNQALKSEYDLSKANIIPNFLLMSIEE